MLNESQWCNLNSLQHRLRNILVDTLQIAILCPTTLAVRVVLLGICTAVLPLQATEAAPELAAVKQAESAEPVTATALQGSLVNKPAWEVGLGGGYISSFDYPASKDPNVVGLVLPFFIYRGEVLRFGGRGGVNAVAIEEPRFKLDFSFGLSLSAESSGNRARQGMPDLDFLFEAGPQLEMLVFRNRAASGGTKSLSWKNSIRGVISTDFSSLDTRGLLLSSKFQWVWRNVAGSSVDLLASSGVSWATSRLHDFFYTVDEQFATTERVAYDSDGGYLGADFSLGFALRPTSALRIFAGVQTENFNGAANESSPLFETTQSTGFALAVVWTAFKSRRSVEVFDAE